MTTQTLDELLDGLETSAYQSDFVTCEKIRAKIKKTLAQPEQEPVAVYVGETWCGSVVRLYEDVPLETPFYTTPPQRTWVGLTDEEIKEIKKSTIYMEDTIRLTEFKLKEKNT